MRPKPESVPGGVPGSLWEPLDTILGAILHDFGTILGAKIRYMLLKWCPKSNKNRPRGVRSIPKAILGPIVAPRPRSGQCPPPLLEDFCSILDTILEAGIDFGTQNGPNMAAKSDPKTMQKHINA